ncbi:hypothetical protein [Candidatus Clostridium stratigraminis]|uniref:Uncharacterized protein n=1 Tax=Candidatus Clostridium stratigraminis TaxID=3381661 RepID=A0ABW8T408_9CLOT
MKEERIGKSIELIGEKNSQGIYEEDKTLLNGIIIKTIDTTDFIEKRKIVMYDENRRMLSEIYVPCTTLVKVEYK